MRLYLEIVRRSIQRSAAYRGATAAGAFTNTAFALINVAVLLAVLRDRPSINGFDEIDTVTFVFMAQGLLFVTGAYAGTDLAERIKRGDVVVDLYRPIDIQGNGLAEAYGRAAFGIVFRGVPPVVVGALLFDLRLPSEPTIWLAFLASVVLAVAVGFAWRFILQCTAFWLLDVRGVNQIGTLVAQFLAGMMVPLFVFPDAVRSIAYALPFAGMLQIPGEVFVGKHRGLELLPILGLQALWAVALLGSGRIMLARAVRKVVVQGG